MLCLLGDVAGGLRALAAGLDGQSAWTGDELAAQRKTLRAAYRPQEEWGPAAIVDTARRTLPRDAIATVDSGAHRILLSQLWDAYGPRELLQSDGLCTMGCAVPLAIGARVPGDLDIHIVMDIYPAHKTAAVKAWPACGAHWHVRFTPTSAASITQVEHRFAELTRKQLQRGVHRSTRQLEADIRAFIDTYDENPRPFKWTGFALLPRRTELMPPTLNSRDWMPHRHSINIVYFERPVHRSSYAL